MLATLKSGTSEHPAVGDARHFVRTVHEAHLQIFDQQIDLSPLLDYTARSSRRTSGLRQTVRPRAAASIHSRHRGSCGKASSSRSRSGSGRILAMLRPHRAGRCPDPLARAPLTIRPAGHRTCAPPDQTCRSFLRSRSTPPTPPHRGPGTRQPPPPARFARSFEATASRRAARRARSATIGRAGRRDAADRVPAIIATIKGAESDITLQAICDRLEVMRERTPRGRSNWRPSSVKMQLERAGKLGLLRQRSAQANGFTSRNCPFDHDGDTLVILSCEGKTVS